MHIKVVKLDGTVVDDTRQPGWKPFELRIGKKFCMPALEDAVRTMQLGEVLKAAWCHKDTRTHRLRVK